MCKALTNKIYQENPKAEVVQIEDIPLEFAFPLQEEDRADNDFVVESMIKEYGFQDTNILLYTGNLVKYQCIGLLLDAWKEFTDGRENPLESCLVIIGGPESVKQENQKRLSQCVWKILSNLVGPKPAVEMGSWMSHALAIVSPRKEGENTPLKVYTYMASGKPIIATDILTHTQVLNHEIAFLGRPGKNN